MKKRLYPQLLVVLQFFLIGMMILFSHGLLHSFAGIVSFLLGLSIGIWALKHNKRDNFTILPILKEGCSLVTSGPYRYVRHPMYTSVFFMMLGIALSSSTLLQWCFLLLLALVLTLKAKREEKLWCHHDLRYHQYKKETKLFLPYIL